MEINEHILEKAVLAAVDLPEMDEGECERSLDELESLLDTAGGEVFARVIQAKSSPDSRTCLGSGKIKELAELCKSNNIDVVIFDNELSPAQIRNIENELDDTRVIDRSMLILDIFAKHAVTGEGKLQVELAQLKYTAPRLTGKGSALSRLGGGIGTRGPGESKLESDRRHLRRRMEQLEYEIRELDKTRLTQRKARERSGIKKIAIVGYTNAGKSTLLNALTGAGILAENKLFATLDPTTRKYTLPCGDEILLTDTVGFIRRLPHHLIKAFKSTLDEAVFADIIIILIDHTDPEQEEKTEVCEKLLNELGASGKPTLFVYNKCDLEEGTAVFEKGDENRLFISAHTGMGLESLVGRIEEIVHEGKTNEVFIIPNAKQGIISRMYEFMTINDVEYGEDCVKVNAVADAKARGMFSEFLQNKPKKVGEDEEWL
ncbi:MAG: GTPase HflX [Ruminococcaceae bacterium]|nr:GTPase HflX [Oscillospiraceae bacterium]